MTFPKIIARTAWVFLALTFPAAAQITITGVADKGNYADTATFTIGATPAGFTDTAFLNTNTVPVGVAVAVKQPDYYDLLVTRVNNTNALDVTQRLVRFLVRASIRAGSEDGLPPWIPYPLILSASNEFAGARLRVIAPSNYPAGLSLPVVVWVENAQGHAVRVNGRIYAAGQPDLTIRRGVGSVLLSATNPAGPFIYRASLPGIESNKVVEIESNTAWTTVSGTLAPNTVWPDNARIHITGNLTNPAGSTLTIGAGAVVKVNAATDIGNNGNIVINGTTDRPVVFAPATPGQPWGGFIQHANNANFTATGALFTGSGAYQGCWFTGHGCSSSLSGIGSHRAEQALISLKGVNCNLTLTDSAAIYLAGQFGHSASGAGPYAITLNRFLMQRCTTGGEYTGALFKVNDSAFMECAEDLSTGASAEFVDGDNDGLYIVNAPTGLHHGFTNTLFGWTKDDGIDSGGDLAGDFRYQSCWFEGTFHEGNSLSGAQNASVHADKDIYHRQGVFLNCGQGIEDGYGGPTGRVDRCLFIGNTTGARFGDNYNWTYYGRLSVTNSILLNNYRDVWGVNFQDWTYRTSVMDVQGNWFTAPNTNHLNNAIWNPATDAAALGDFLTIPPGSRVGVALATWKTTFSPGELTNDLPVGLSTFTPQTVSVEYAIEAPGVTQPLQSGTLVFQPGEILKNIKPQPSVVASGRPQLRVILRNPIAADLTGPSQVMFAAAPTGTINTNLVSAGAQWKYFDKGVDLNTAWRAPGFDDSGWSNGLAQLGFNDGDEITRISQTNAAGVASLTWYFRKNFTVADPAAFSALNLWLLRDDGGVVYLNGTDVFRSPTMPQAPTAITYQTLATNLSVSTAPSDNSVDRTNTSPALLVAGTNVVAVEIHQHRADSSDVSFDFSLTGLPGAVTRPILTPVQFTDGWVLAWTDAAAVLESAENVIGPWLPMGGAQSPFAVTPDGAQRFYRLRK